MKRIIAKTILSGAISVAVILCIMGFGVVNFMHPVVGAWVRWGLVITAIVMVITFAVSWLDMDKERSAE